MRKPYPIANHRQPSRAIYSRPDSRLAGRISIVAIQEEIQHPARHPAQRGPAGARRLKIVRIEQITVLSDAPVDARAPFSVSFAYPRGKKVAISSVGSFACSFHA